MNFTSKLLLCVPATLFLAGATTASTIDSPVVVTFNEGEGFHSIIQFDPTRQRASGSWEENGFSVAWSQYDAQPTELAINRVLSVNDSVFLSDTAGTPDPTTASITFTRTDQRPFSLEQFNVLGTASSWRGDASFIPFAADGSLDLSRAIFADLNVVYENLLLSGVTVDGSIVEMPINTFIEGPSVGGGARFTTGGDGVVNIENGALANLTSLTVDLSTFPSTAEFFRQTLEYSDVDSILQIGFEQCLVQNPLGYGCTFDGFGQFSFSADSGFFQNWGSAASVDDFSFLVSDVALIPLPAASLLLLAGVASLGVIRARKGAKT